MPVWRSFVTSSAKWSQRSCGKSYSKPFFLSTLNCFRIANLFLFSWISGLPFKPAVWAAMSVKKTTKLVLDVGKPLTLNPANDYRDQHLEADDMAPLIQFTALEELRIFSMHLSYQSIIWETVYRNKSDSGMIRVLDLEMVEAPIIRQKHWLVAADVTGLNVEIDEPNTDKYES